MPDKFVDLEALNLRTTPNSSSLANRIGILHLGQPVKEIGPASTTGWVEIDAEIEGATKRGVVKAEIDGLASLRETVSKAREALIAEAIKEWLRFKQGQGKEFVDPFSGFVGEMWQAIGLDLDGKDRGVPWSAAAISFMVRNAGNTFPKYKNFKFAAAHSKYMHDSIKKQKAGDANAPFWGFQLFEKRPEIGDIVGQSRGSQGHGFQDAEDGRSFISHCDIIVSERPDFVLAIGGNVKQSVSISRYEKTPGGFIDDNDGDTIILMVNQA
ncbi:MAG: DUF2272 domain-containing protein [Methylococcales bacterium]|nr:DUF2272 domain-containing protein [Methylococcales bacterium]